MQLGFIGCGNMAKAMIKGIIASGAVAPGEIYGSNATPEHAAAVAEEFGINAGTNNITVAENADILFLSVKPYQYEAVIAEIRGAIRPEQTVVTIAPGKTIAWLEEQFGMPVRIVRTAPNTPAHVLAGVTAYCPNSSATAEDVVAVECLLASFGTTVELEESQLDAASAIGGSSPAYVYMFIEALADAGVAEGLKRPQAYQLAAQGVLGAAKLVLESGKHPGQLKDEVCSPSGSTIRGLEVLEKGAFRGTVIDALRTTIEKARAL